VFNSDYLAPVFFSGVMMTTH